MKNFRMVENISGTGIGKVWSCEQPDAHVDYYLTLLYTSKV
jgi:hypothetical protein